MRRVKVKAQDVMLPFAILFIANFAVLLSWTLVAPLHWTRVEVANFDHFGRSVESYGTCFAAEYKGNRASARNAFMISLAVFNFFAVVFANYESYLSRHLPSDFNETFYITLSMASILEGFLIGAPILFMAGDNPTSFFVVSSVLIAFVCLAILLPMFVPKLAIRFMKLNQAEWRGAWRTYAETSSQRRSAARSSGGDSSQPFSGEGSDGIQHLSSSAEMPERVAQRAGVKSPQVPTGTVAEIRARAAQKAKLDSAKGVEATA
jgi:hypothetical protein